MMLVISPTGLVHCLYDEMLDLTVLGRPTIVRASRVDPTSDGRWTADLSPLGGPTLGPFAIRSAALGAERAWLERHWLSAE